MRKKHRNMCGTRDGGCSAVTAGGGGSQGRNIWYMLGGSRSAAPEATASASQLR